MPKLIIEGGNKLTGTIKVNGSKNSALPIIASTLLTREKCIIKNVPRIKDIETMLQILSKLGADVSWIDKNKVSICTKNVKNFIPNPDLVKKIRASVLLIGPLLARFGKIKLAQPGGCLIGARSLDTHLKIFKDIGTKIKLDKSFYYFELKNINNSNIILDEISVTATENILMLSVLSNKNIKIGLAACEPEVTDLINFLKKMGAKIKGKDSHFLEISGVKKLKGAKHKIIPDRIEAGTFLIAGAITGGHLIVDNIIVSHLDIFLNKLKEIGVKLKIMKKKIEVFPSNYL